MAPEQIEGRVAHLDARTDVFAFGAVLYEMATGRKAFDGKSSASIIAEILAGSPPPLTSLQPIAPPQLDRVVQKCLAKEPDGRWQSAADLRDELQWIAQDAAQASSRAATPTPAACAASVLAALACSAVASSAARPEAQARTRASFLANVDCSCPCCRTSGSLPSPRRPSPCRRTAPGWPTWPDAGRRRSSFFGS
jgi:serine/threonine-protein kinase